MDHTPDHTAAPAPVQLPVLHWGQQDAPRRVLLLHGLTSAAACWWRVADALASAGCSVTAPDLRGHGLAPRTVRYDIGGFVADVLALRPPGHGAPEWDLVVGHSLGGLVATAAATAPHADPGWARRLLLLDPPIAVREEVVEAFVGSVSAEVRDADPEQMLRQNPTWHPEDAFLKAQAARRTTPYVVDSFLRGNAPWSYEKELAAYPHPVTLLAADPARHGVFGPDLGRRIEQAGGGTFRWSVVEGAGHSLYRDAPDTVIAAALEALEEAPPVR
ncbi:alpha/beta hydrolase [Streptomyces sp. NPDC093085]|uniref:alpha/beta fold hydrolase n=1 Tax=Streptomyces sp. NPDC093085 TaxID=3155068 RepID=UPI003419DE5B